MKEYLDRAVSLLDFAEMIVTPPGNLNGREKLTPTAPPRQSFQTAAAHLFSTDSDKPRREGKSKKAKGKSEEDRSPDRPLHFCLLPFLLTVDYVASGGSVAAERPFGFSIRCTGQAGSPTVREGV